MGDRWGVNQNHWVSHGERQSFTGILNRRGHQVHRPGRRSCSPGLPPQPCEPCSSAFVSPWLVVNDNDYLGGGGRGWRELEESRLKGSRKDSRQEFLTTCEQRPLCDSVCLFLFWPRLAFLPYTLNSPFITDSAQVKQAQRVPSLGPGRILR